MQYLPDVVRETDRLRPQPHEASTSRKRPLRLEASWADSVDDLRRAQRLRYQVFAGEMGARLCPIAGTPPGHDADRFDDFCAHLLVRAIFPGEQTHEVVGTYRVLTPDAARRAGGFYSETEFDLGRLWPMRARMAELGRSCIHPAWRTGGTILALWSALGEFMVVHGLDVAFGCASVGMGDGGHAAASLWRQLSALHLAAPERRVRPQSPADRVAARRPERRDAAADPRLSALRRRAARAARVGPGLQHRRPADADDLRRPAAASPPPLSGRRRELAASASRTSWPSRRARAPFGIGARWSRAVPSASRR